MDATTRLAKYLREHQTIVGKVVDFDPSTDELFLFDFTAANTELTFEVIADTPRFAEYLNRKLAENRCTIGIGGYMEHRTLYARSVHFDTEDEPRRLHLGTDIWMPAGTPVYTPLNGVIHSFRDNDHFGDYGPTIILHHQLDGLELYSLYGHLSRKSLEGLVVGAPVKANQQIATFGNTEENGQWPPHLHFQLMLDMEACMGDYPGVCRFSEKEKYQQNIPDPDLFLKFV
jgi:murein DD-endopeptidase MepM/ murein hydrolase activator NlpD